GFLSDAVQVSSVCYGPFTNGDQNLLPKVSAGDFTIPQPSEDWTLIPASFPTFADTMRFSVADKVLCAEDFASLLPKQQLTDAAIDAFLKLMGTNIAKKTGACVEVIASHMLETASMGYADMFLQSAIENNLICRDLILVPALVDRNHWILFVVRVRDRSIFLLDSLPKSNLSLDRLEKLQVLLWLLDECHRNVMKSLVPWKQWSIYYPQDIIRQSVSNDCGVFVCLWAYTLWTERNPPSKMNAVASKRFRSFVARSLMAAGSVLLCEAPLPDNRSTDDVIHKVYQEYDKLLSKNELIIERPWLNAVVNLSIPKVPTIKALLAPLWQATTSKCGAPWCTVSGPNRPPMMQCEVGREWLHQKCVLDTTTADVWEKGYMCPKHHKFVHDPPGHERDDGYYGELHNCGSTRRRGTLR
ncbi:Sentrin-specific protease 2, partial [Frankliniella fusca]